jgi:hypothetical protein
MLLVCFTSLQEVLWQHFIFNVFAFIPILNDKKYYIKICWVCSWLFLYLIILHLYERILVLIMNYSETAHFDAFQTLYFLLDEKYYKW